MILNMLSSPVVLTTEELKAQTKEKKIISLEQIQAMAKEKGDLSLIHIFNSAVRLNRGIFWMFVLLLFILVVIIGVTAFQYHKVVRELEKE